MRSITSFLIFINISATIYKIFYIFSTFSPLKPKKIGGKTHFSFKKLAHNISKKVHILAFNDKINLYISDIIALFIACISEHWAAIVSIVPFGTFYLIFFNTLYSENIYSETNIREARRLADESILYDIFCGLSSVQLPLFCFISFMLFILLKLAQTNLDLKNKKHFRSEYSESPRGKKLYLLMVKSIKKEFNLDKIYRRLYILNIFYLLISVFMLYCLCTLNYHYLFFWDNKIYEMTHSLMLPFKLKWGVRILFQAASILYSVFFIACYKNYSNYQREFLKMHYFLCTCGIIGIGFFPPNTFSNILVHIFGAGGA